MNKVSIVVYQVCVVVNKESITIDGVHKMMNKNCIIKNEVYIKLRTHLRPSWHSIIYHFLETVLEIQIF